MKHRGILRDLHVEENCLINSVVSGNLNETYDSGYFISPFTSMSFIAASPILLFIYFFILKLLSCWCNVSITFIFQLCISHILLNVFSLLYELIYLSLLSSFFFFYCVIKHFFCILFPHKTHNVFH